MFTGLGFRVTPEEVQHVRREVPDQGLLQESGAGLEAQGLGWNCPYLAVILQRKTLEPNS